MEESHWYYVSPASKTQEGPLGVEDMKQLYRQGQVNEDTYAWHEDAEEWCQLRVLRYQGQTLREICAVESAPGSRKSTEIYSGERTALDSIEDRSLNHLQPVTETSHLPSSSVILPSKNPTNQGSSEPSSSSESSSSGPVPSKQDSEDSDLEAGWDWVERKNSSGHSVFVNVRTGVSTQERPEVLEEVVWLEEEKEGYMAGKVEKGRVVRLDGKPVNMDREQASSLACFHRGLLTACPAVLPI